MLSIVTALFHFILNAVDPHQTCEITHRDPGVAGTYYLYCAQQAPDGVELITVGRFVSDAKAKTP
jgi:hypothetical protein